MERVDAREEVAMIENVVQVSADERRERENDRERIETTPIEAGHSHWMLIDNENEATLEAAVY
jgi:hypothetical protein